MQPDEVLDGLIEVERRCSAALGEQTSPANSWEELEVRLGIEAGGSGVDHTAGPKTSDNLVSVLAGLAGGLLDLQPAIADSLTSESMHQRINNAFIDKVKSVTGARGPIAIDNAMGGGKQHRLVGPTHDLFRLFTTIRLVREGRFESAVNGILISKDAYRDGLPPYLKVDNPSDALVLVMMHWTADFFSRQSLPIPGWSKLAEIDDREFVEWLFKAYREGANLRALVTQFLSNLSGLALISILLHIYRFIDMLWITECAALTPSNGQFRLSEDLRFRWMSRNANLTAMAVSSADCFRLASMAGL